MNYTSIIYIFIILITKIPANICWQMTAADILVYTVTEYISFQFPEVRKMNTWVKNWLTAMEADVKFSEYLKNRPPSVFGV